jgi:N-acetylglucosamine kinase-like BadF-type ATPase
LLDELRQHLSLVADLDLVDVVLNRWRAGRREIAALSRPVVAAARAGDVLAGTILDDAAVELARLVVAARSGLGFPAQEVVPVSYSGGMFSVPEVVAAFARELGRSGAIHDLRVPRYPPVLGAALYAAQLAGTPLSPTALSRLAGAVTG